MRQCPTVLNHQQALKRKSNDIFKFPWAIDSLRPNDACIDNVTIIGLDNGMSPGRHLIIIRTNAGIVLIGPLGRNFSETLIGIHKFSFMKRHLKLSSAKWHHFVSAAMC